MSIMLNKLYLKPGIKNVQGFYSISLIFKLVSIGLLLKEMLKRIFILNTRSCQT